MRAPAFFRVLGQDPLTPQKLILMPALTASPYLYGIRWVRFRRAMILRTRTGLTTLCLRRLLADLLFLPFFRVVDINIYILLSLFV